MLQFAPKEILCKNGSVAHQFHGFQGYKAVGQMATEYYKEIYYDPHPEILENYLFYHEFCSPEFFSIYDYTDYAVGEHWEFLTEYLGFQFGALSFNFTESDCASPAIMAHIRAIKAERVFNLTYANGILDYLQLAIRLMKDKKFPEHLILMTLVRYLSNPGIERTRRIIQAFLLESYDISEENIICMVFSPFCDQCERLKTYITQEKPELSEKIDLIVEILRRGKIIDSSEERIVGILTDLSGLSFQDIQNLYTKHSLFHPKNHTIMRRVLHDDPHKLQIETRHELRGPIINEVISGR